MKALHLTLLYFSLFYLNFTSAQKIWTQLNGPNGVAIQNGFITKEGHIFAFTNTEEMFLSSDQGNSFIAVSGISNSCSNSFNQFKQSPSGEVYFYFKCVLYKFDQSKNQFIIQNKNLSILNFIFTTDGTKLIAASNDKLLISSNEGSTFIEATSWKTKSVDFFITIPNSNYVQLYNDTSYNLFRFNDLGQNLEKISSSSTRQSYLYSAPNKTIFSIGNQLQKSTDYGYTWQNISLNNASSIFSISQLKNDDLLTIGRSFYRSTDNGLTWNLDTVTYANNELLYPAEFLSINKDGKILLNKNKSLQILHPNKEIQKLQVPIDKPMIRTIKNFNDSVIICQTDHYDQISTNYGQSWNILDDKFEYAHFSDGTIIKYFLPTIQTSIDHGKTWMTHEFPSRHCLGRSEKMLINSQNKALIYCGDSLYNSIDKCKTWTVNALNFKRRINSSSPNISKNNIVYGEILDSISLEQDLYYSTDYISIIKIPKIKQMILRDYIVSKSNTIYIEGINPTNSNSTLLYSKDFGLNYSSYPIPLNSKLILIDDCDQLYFLNPIYKLIEKSSILDLTKKDTISIQEFGNIDGASVMNLVMGEDGYLYCGIPLQKLYKSNQSHCKIETSISSQEPSSKQLNAIPNPFSDQTKIKVPSEFQHEKLQVSITDMHGRIINSFVFIGNEIDIINSNLSSGLYIVRIKTEGGISFICKIIAM